ncbi:hypothetical protein GCM10027416_22510 [Okibacterium endophyticum]
MVRTVILAYFEDGDDLVTLAMNGWDESDPAWWLNLRANPDAHVDLPGRQTRSVRGRAAAGAERERLWSRFSEFAGWGDINAFSHTRDRERPLVVLEPRD